MTTPTFPVAPPPPLWIALARHELAQRAPGPVTLYLDEPRETLAINRSPDHAV